MARLRLRYFALLLLSGMALNVRVNAAEDRAIEVGSEDREMNNAIQQAREKLPHFWRTYEAPKDEESGFALKVAVKDGDQVEHFWCTGVKREKGTITGVVGNEPQQVKSVKEGQRLTIDPADISDWLYLRKGKVVGNYTVRPLMKYMTREERAFLRANLGELP